jgi:PAS domain S-box-containing protein
MMWDWVSSRQWRLQKRFMVITGAGVVVASLCALAMVVWFQMSRMEERLHSFSENELASLNTLVDNVMASRRTDPTNIAITIFNNWFESRNVDYPGRLWSVWSSKTISHMAERDPRREPKLPRDEIDQEAIRTGRPVARFVEGAYRYSVPIVLGKTKGADGHACLKCHQDLLDEHSGDVIAVFSSSLSTEAEYAGLRRMIAIMAAASVVLAVTVMLSIRAILGRVIGRPLARMTGSMTQLASGSLEVEVPDRDRLDEIGDMARAVEVFKQNAMDKLCLEDAQHAADETAHRVTEEQRERETAIVNEVAAVAKAAAAGDLDRRIDLTGKEGFLLNLCQEVNNLIHLSGVALKDVAGVLAAVAKGTLNKRITGEYGGLFGQLKDDVNNTAGKLLEMMTSLKATAGRLKLVLETAAEGIYGVDDENRVVFSNRAAAELLGWPSPEAMLGRHGEEVLGHLLADGTPCTRDTCAIRHTLDDGQVRRISGEYFTGCGDSRRPVEFAVSPLTVEDITVGAVMVFRDITEKQRIERKVSRLLAFQRGVLEAAGNAIIVTNRAGIITLFNPAAESLLGYQAEELVGNATPLLFHDSAEVVRRGQEAAEVLRRKVDGFQVFVAKAEAKRMTDINEWTYVRRDGARIPVLLSVNALSDAEGEITGYIGVAQNVSMLKAMESDLKRSNAELERFAYVASHDLRQPLRMVTSFLGLVEKKLKGTIDPETQGFITFAVDGAKRMDRMIIDLLEYSRIGRGGPSMEVVPLSAVVDRARKSLALAVADVGAEISVAPDLPEILGNPSELERLFQNLMSNAVKFRAKDRAPQVTITCQRKEREWLVSVTDNGIGIDPQHHERLFNIFQRLVSREQYEGNGIGLASCRKIVERHGGRIWVESAPGEGSTFTVALPAQLPKLA